MTWRQTLLSSCDEETLVLYCPQCLSSACNQSTVLLTSGSASAAKQQMQQSQFCSSVSCH
eukprot:146844-Amphidinium_carterae.1